MDTRVKWLISRVADAFDDAVDALTSQFASKGLNTELLEFLTPSAHPCIMLHCNPQRPHIFTLVTEEQGLPSNSEAGARIIYFVRTSSKSISMSNIDSDILHGVFSADLLPSIHTMLAQIYLPLLENQHSWGPNLEGLISANCGIDLRSVGGEAALSTLQAISNGNNTISSASADSEIVTNFRFALRKYVSSIDEANEVLKSCFVLPTPEDATILKLNPNDIPSLRAAAAENAAIIDSAERIIENVCSSIELYLSECSRYVKKMKILVLKQK